MYLFDIPVEIATGFQVVIFIHYTCAVTGCLWDSYVRYEFVYFFYTFTAGILFTTTFFNPLFLSKPILDILTKWGKIKKRPTICTSRILNGCVRAVGAFGNRKFV